MRGPAQFAASALVLPSRRRSRERFVGNAQAAINLLPIVHDPNVARWADGKIGLHLQTSANVAAAGRNLVTRLHPWRAIFCADAPRSLTAAPFQLHEGAAAIR
jgi:hypothetical protein